MTLFDLGGKTALVVAGASTLGRAIAHGLASHGADVAITSRSADKARVLSGELAEHGHRTSAHAADATDKADLQRVLASVLEWSGRLDVLVNCPGQNSATPFFEIEMEEWDSIMEANLKSVVLACQVFGEHMTSAGNGGSIINISSASAGPPLSRVFSYSASKAAVDNVTMFLAREFASRRVRVNAIVPGFFPAEQNRKILSAERVEAIMRHTPLARFGSPEELQGAAVWLASEAASGFVTGALIRVDGGFGAMTI